MSSIRAIARNSNATSKAPTGGITEIILPDDQHASVYLPSLAFLSQTKDSRWLTWVVTEKVDKESLRLYGFDLYRTRFVYPDSSADTFSILVRALEEGNSHTVVGSLGRLTESQIMRLETAAHVGRCHGLLLRGRNGEIEG
ncbi:hypothetical protein DWB84_05590 [Saccharophagus sp. K07]|jgi:cell division inhibitor SulA|uniref:cell division inhibitor SulA n=1 Tax=Saccharophagus sp. K07 TaxID=2283636 RepID=UPI001651B1F9|nr:SulA-like leucine-rich domain-containing protein [Saccharophagus sp. K07]MBC6904935.1 hypothetical protein [Saccharophagus sp. K07]